MVSSATGLWAGCDDVCRPANTSMIFLLLPYKVHTAFNQNISTWTMSFLKGTTKNENMSARQGSTAPLSAYGNDPVIATGQGSSN